MSESSPADIQFLTQLNEAIARNLANEQFGVTELAEEMNMSRSNLLRKVKKSTNLPVNQLIREARLTRAMELLQNSASNVSEVSHQVGFNSTSYFIKCFREYYGYPPGEAGKKNPSEISPQPVTRKTYDKKWIVTASVLLVVAIVTTLAYYFYNRAAPQSLERSIVVLPFKNESNDSTNVYLINGLMESTLNNLQKIEDLRVLSRTSSEKYRNTTKSIVEMASELKVNYFVEGSGQKIGNEILLNIQLIEGPTDKHLWAKQYRREASDIFALQQEVAKNIAEEIEVAMSPEVKQRIEKIPTENLEAYDLYLKGKDQFYQSTGGSLTLAMENFRKAIALDDKFGLAYAHLAMVEYYLDFFMVDKHYTEEITTLADKAELFDPKSAESLIAKGLAYAYKKEYKSAVLYLEKAHEYDPHSALVHHFLTEFHALYVPDPAKYIEYALRGAKDVLISGDSSAIAFRYFHLANAMIQAGFVDEALEYSDKSLAYEPNAFFARYVSVLFHFAKTRDFPATKRDLIVQFEKDTTRVDIVKELAKICYVNRDYKSAYRYYNTFLRLRDRFHMEVYKDEFISIAFVYEQMGEKEKAATYVKAYKEFVDTEKSLYKPMLLAVYYAHARDTKEAINQLRIFSKEEKWPYWMLLIDSDPLFDPLRTNPEFNAVINDMKTEFWERKEKIQEDLEDKGLYPFEEYLGL